mmetsp:Transcript_14155/g.47237  ORF Transcript_14155/g.47237 Transcript_14155/m.47237 type:complete len:261 (-) Transcript_14155:50-832(-)
MEASLAPGAAGAPEAQAPRASPPARESAVKAARLQDDGRRLSSEDDGRPSSLAPSEDLVHAVHVQLIPLVAESTRVAHHFTILSGYTSADDDIIIAEAEAVLQLAWAIFVLGIVLETIFLAIAAATGGFYYGLVVDLLIHVLSTGCVLWVGVTGVRSRNARCFCSANCGWLSAFQVMYIVIAVITAIGTFIAILAEDWIRCAIGLAFLGLEVACADHSRRLIEAIQNNTFNQQSRRPQPAEAVSAHFREAPTAFAYHEGR